MNKKSCDKECKGIIKEIRTKGHEYAPMIIVEYKIDNKTYELKESLIHRPYEKKKLGFIPIGYKTKSLIEIRTGTPAIVGNEVKIRYCSSEPNVAFLPDNDSKINWY